ncbi:MAG: putative sugar nucleotidyl transferase [Chitinophagales bacterium]
MNEIHLDDRSIRENFYPFTATRHVADIRIGILTIREKWEQLFGTRVIEKIPSGAKRVAMPAEFIPNKKLAEMIFKGEDFSQLLSDQSSVRKIEYPWQIFQMNDEMLRIDYELLTRNRRSKPISQTNRTLSPENIFVEEGAKVEYATLNASTGPIYIGKDAEIMEGAMIRGPFALCHGGLVKMGSTIYGATTIGPGSVVGGEIKNSVFFGYSNKGHSGYLGDSVIGEWCNLGAGTSNSNIKNNAGRVKVWNEFQKDFHFAGTKCGVLMGDYVQTAINTSLNTGTVIGPCANVFGEGLSPKFIPSFSWGRAGKYELDKALEAIDRWKKLKNHSLSASEMQILKHIFEESKLNLA